MFPETLNKTEAIVCARENWVSVRLGLDWVPHIRRAYAWQIGHTERIQDGRRRYFVKADRARGFWVWGLTDAEAIALANRELARRARSAAAAAGAQVDGIRPAAIVRGQNDRGPG